MTHANPEYPFSMLATSFHSPQRATHRYLNRIFLFIYNTIQKTAGPTPASFANVRLVDLYPSRNTVTYVMANSDR